MNNYESPPSVDSWTSLSLDNFHKTMHRRRIIKKCSNLYLENALVSDLTSISFEINSKLGAMFYNSISAKLKLNNQLNHQIYFLKKSHLSRSMILPSMRETMGMYNSESFTCTLMLGIKHSCLASFEEVQFRHCIPNPI